MYQLEELRASELALRVRVKSLTSELALLRRGLDNLVEYSISLQCGAKAFMSVTFISGLNLFLQQSDSDVNSLQLPSRRRNLSLAVPREEAGIWDSQGSFRIPGAQRGQSAKVRGKGEKSRLLWPTPQHPQTLAFSYRCLHVPHIPGIQPAVADLNISSLNILQGHALRGLIQLLISRTDSAGRKKQKSKSLFLPLLR